jgi:hypothetical protein
MRIFYLTVLLLYLAAFPTACLAGNGAPSLDPRAEKLLGDIEARKSLPISDERWKFANGPWADYLTHYLREGPGSEYHALLNKAWKNNDCPEMIAVLRNNFVQRYPYLAPAHTKEHVQDYFKWTFIYEIPFFSYCRAKAELKLAFDLSERRKLRVFPFYALWATKRRSSKFEGRPEDTPQNRARNTLCSAFEKLTRLALVDRHIPAIRDLIGYAGTPSLIVLTPEQEYILVKIATHSGLYDPEVDELGTSSRASIDLKKREEIDRFFAEEKRGLPPISILSVYWRCSEPFIDPLLKMLQHRKEK